MSLERRVRGVEHELFFLPHHRLQQFGEPEPQGCGIPDRLQDVPLDFGVEAIDVQSCEHGLCADRGAYDGPMRELPRWRQVCGNADRLLLVSQDGIHNDDKPEPCGGVVPDDLPDLSHDSDMVRSNIQPYVVSDLLGLTQGTLDNVR